MSSFQRYLLTVSFVFVMQHEEAVWPEWFFWLILAYLVWDDEGMKRIIRVCCSSISTDLSEALFGGKCSLPSEASCQHVCPVGGSSA